MTITTRTVLLAALSLSPLPVLACASCGCTIGGDWQSQGFTTEPGLRLELRYDYLDQSQLYSGTGTVDRGSLALPNDREIEQDTRNRYTTFSLDYSPDADWGINVQVPYIDRAHATIAEGDTGISSSHTRSIGDVKIIGRYQGLAAQRNVGVQFGLKLPTGDYRRTFDGGPQAGELLDRGLQPGSGSIDWIAGAFHVGSVNENWSYFTQAMAQGAISGKEDYRPGTALNLNAGARYTASEVIAPELQINARAVRRDTGANADTENSGGVLIYLTPGVSGSITNRLDAFGFVQLPVYRRVNGYQLTPRYTLSIGVRYHL